jgi:hypothetical protein
MCSSPKMPPMPEPPKPLPPPEPPPPPPINPQRNTQMMTPADVSGGLPTINPDEYTRRGRGRSALTIPLEGAATGGLNIPTG